MLINWKLFLLNIKSPQVEEKFKLSADDKQKKSVVETWLIIRVSCKDLKTGKMYTINKSKDSGKDEQLMSFYMTPHV